MHLNILPWKFLLALTFSVGLSLSSIASAEPRDEVAAITTEWAAAFSEHNVDRIVALYSKDALVWGTNGTSLRTTPDEVRGFFQGAFKIPNLKVAFDNQTIRLFGNVAVVAGGYTFTASRDGQSQNNPARYSFTLIKDGERWLIIDHNSSAMPGPNTPSRRT